MSDYTVADLYAAARNAGFTPAESVTAVAISLAEDSTRSLRATNHNTNGTTDYGPWQINSVHLTPQFVATYGSVFNLQDNARMAHAIYKSQGWQAWSTYNSGAYRAHMKAAQTVAKKQGNNVSFSGALGHTLTNGAIGNAKDIYKMITTGQVSQSQALFGGLAPIGDFFAHLSDSGMWKRIGIGALAVLLVLFGIIFMLESNKGVQHVTETAALA